MSIEEAQLRQDQLLNEVGAAVAALAEVGQVVTVTTIRLAIVDGCGDWTAAHAMVAWWYCRNLGAH